MYWMPNPCHSDDPQFYRGEEEPLYCDKFLTLAGLPQNQSNHNDGPGITLQPMSF